MYKSLALFFLSFLTTYSFGQHKVVYKETTELVELGKYCKMYSDSTNKMTFEEIKKLPPEKWVQSQNEIINMGETKATAWLMFEVENKTPEALFLIIEFPNLHYYDTYSVQSDSSLVETHWGGIAQPFSSRKIRTQTPTLKVGLSPQKIYISAKSVNSLVLPIQIGGVEAISNRLHREDIIAGFIVGVMLVMAFFNLFFFFNVGEKMYLYYSLYVVFSCMVLMEFTGSLYEIAWRLFGIETGDFYGVTIGTTIFGAMFSMNFLKTKQKSPVTHIVLIVLIVVAIVINPLIFSNLSRTFHRNILLTLTFVSIYGTGWYIYLKGYKPARFFIMAWTVYLTGLICAAAAEGGLVSFNHWWTYYGYQIGACAEALLLSLALPDRIAYYQILSQEAEFNRQRLSHDLHDDMGATLTSIGYLGSAAKKNIAKNPFDTAPLLPLIEQMIMAGKQATESMRGMLWALSPENEETDAFLNKLITHFGDMLRAGVMKGEFQIEGDATSLKLSAYQRRNLFMFLKESLQNILKHSEASHADIVFLIKSNLLTVSVEDNGKGFEQQNKFDGYGLQTMNYRAQELKATLKVESKIGTGTKLTLGIPIK